MGGLALDAVGCGGDNACAHRLQRGCRVITAPLRRLLSRFLMPDPLPNDPSSTISASDPRLAELSGVALRALLWTDQSRCWQRGERPRVEDYVRRFPALADDHETLLDLLFREALLREEQGEAPDLEEY